MPRAALEAMHDAGRRLQECIQVLAKTNDNVVGELLRHQGTFYEWDHYPKGDVYDGETHAQYYYHAHPAPNRGREHGHFHTFLRPRGMPHGIKPAPLPDMQPPKEDNDALSHLIAISMNPVGAPIRLFTTNRWVTGETWYTADSVKAMLPSFAIGHAQPSWPANIWITNMLRLFRPQIEALIDARDQAIAAWQRDHPDSNVFEDRTLEVTSVMPISLARQLAAIKRALDRKSSSDL
ncbi:MAG: hypothetical protein D6782_08995 [Alphaproteobacteria bacterium]|nr:MAG: hypothetical protein D6782_08995 [Alphaproteobacteria bacterium]